MSETSALRHRGARLVLMLLVAVAMALLVPRCATGAPTPTEELVVGVKQIPPFSFKDEAGKWHGTSIELWEEIARDLDWPYRFHETDLPGILGGLQDGTLDVGVAAITVTSQREAVLDFTHPFYTAGLAVAVVRDDTPTWFEVGRGLASGSLLQFLGVLALLQLLAGLVVWQLERRHNPEQFGGRGIRGALSGFWWATVTMTTVGYGDKAPVTAAGRTVALVWMLCSVVAISSFTATITSALTVHRLEGQIREPADLARFRVGVVAYTTSEQYARAAALDFVAFTDVGTGLDAVAAAKIDALIYDAPLLKYAAGRHPDARLHVLPPRFQRQDYAIALPEGSPLREAINRVLPEKTRSESPAG